MSRALEDRNEIVALLDRFAEALDLRRWELLDAVFADDVDYDFVETRVRGRAEAVRVIRSYLDACGPSQHLLGNYRVSVAGDRATSRVYVRAFHAGVGRAAGVHYEMGGEYADELRRTRDGWRSVRRTMKPLFERGSREVLGPGPGRREAGPGDAKENA
jgi:hypothetical protein